MSRRQDQEFTEYVTARLGWLRRLAYLLCQDTHRVDDLVQTAITRLYQHWDRVRAVEHLDAYTRTVLFRVYLREQESGWSKRVRLGMLPDAEVTPIDSDSAVDLRAALAALPARQRATLVLRFYCDLNVDQAAELLGVTAGTVKSQTAKGLAAMRQALGSDPDTYRPATAKQEVTEHG